MVAFRRRPGRAPAARTIALVSLTALMAPLLSGCSVWNDTGLPPSDSIVVQVTPAQVTVPVGGSVVLSGSATGSFDHWIYAWSVSEMGGAPGEGRCSFTETPQGVSCPYGYIGYPAGGSLPSSATYHAPAVAGTYHVVFTIVIIGGYSGYAALDKSATATITVTP